MDAVVASHARGGTPDATSSMASGGVACHTERMRSTSLRQSAIGSARPLEDATRIAYAQRLHRDVPVRLARRVVGLAEGLPPAVHAHPAFGQLVQQHDAVQAVGDEPR